MKKLAKNLFTAFIINVKEGIKCKVYQVVIVVQVIS